MEDSGATDLGTEKKTPPTATATDDAGSDNDEEADEISQWLSRTGDLVNTISSASASIANIYLEQVTARLNAVQERDAFVLETFAETLEDMKEDVSKSNSRWMELFKARDYAGISKLYTTDCKMMVSGCEMMIGREAAIKCFEGMANTGIDHGVMETDELHQAGEFLIERGHYAMLNAENAEVDKGKYCVVWKKEDGQWKMYWDCPNSNYVSMS